jgi:hypothetical protein
LGIAKAQRLRVRAMGSYGTSRAHKLEQLFVTRLARLARYC